MATKKELEQMIHERDNSIKELVRTIGVLESKVAEVKNKADDMFCNSVTYKQMEKEIERLNAVIKADKISIEAKENTIKNKLDVIQRLKSENEQLKQDINKFKNKCNVGRKEKFTSDEKATINMLRLANNSYRAIAKQMGCSVGTIHKIIKEMEQK